MVYTDIPLVDLHRHLEGSLRPETILELARDYHQPLPAWDVEGLRPHVQVAERPEAFHGLMSIAPKFAIAQQLMVDYAACRRLAWACLEGAAREGIDYLELRFSPLFMADRHGLDPLGVASAVCEAWEEARRVLPMRSRLIVILSRHYGPDACRVELQAAIAHRNRGVVAVDLAGDEAHFPGSLFADHYRQAREAGLRLTAHAGEFAGAESVGQAVRELGVERVGHGIHAADDPAILDLLAERGVAIESCPTSNVQFNNVPSYRAHPLPLFLQRGLLATLNTDDPGISAIDLGHEYRVAQEEIGLGPADLRRLQVNGLAAAFLTAAERAELRQARGLG